MLGNQRPTSTTSMAEVRSSSSRRTTRASRRAGAAPTQKCAPLPKLLWPSASLRIEAEFAGHLEARRVAIGRAPQQQQVRVGGQVAHQQLAVHRVGRVVGGGQHVGRPAEGVHREGLDATAGCVGDGRGQVGREILGAPDRLVDRIPAAHGIELRRADAVHRPDGVHALVQRVRILQGLVGEKRAGILDGTHPPRVT